MNLPEPHPLPRRNEDATGPVEAGILDALSAHVALLDGAGRIVLVNRAWRSFGIAPVPQGPGHRIGVDYLELCATARGEGADAARQAAEGMRFVLGGKVKSFAMEYQCHSSAGHCWFLMTVTPAARADAVGAVVMHVNITDRVERDEGLRRFRAAMESSGDAISLVDRASMRYIDVNQTCCDMVGRSREELLGMSPMDLFNANRAALERDYDALIADADSSAGKVEGVYRHKYGMTIPVEVRRRALLTDGGWVIVGTARDVSARKDAEAKIVRLNRVYAVLSGINSAVVRIRERGALFAEVCRVAVSEAEFFLARVIELDAQGRGRIAATSETDTSVFQRVLDLHNEDPAKSNSVLTRVLRDGRPIISNDVAGDLRIPQRAALTQNGNYALALLPLVVDGRVAGAIILRSHEAGLFDAQELRLLLELTANVSLALDRIEKEESLARFTAERERGEETLRRFAGAMDATTDAIYVVDRSSMDFVHVNTAACRMQSRTREQLMKMGPAAVLMTPLGDLARTYDAIIESGIPAVPLELLRNREDGSQVWVELRRHAQRSGERWTIVTLVRDVTEQKTRGEQLRRFRAAMDLSGDAILLIDRASLRYIDVNRTLCELVGYTREEMLGMTPMDLFSADRETLERDYDKLIANNDSSASKVEGQYRHKDGSLIPIETRRHAMLTNGGWIIVGTARDVTERNEAQEKIRRLNRVHAMLSGINALIVRVRDRDELFRQACRIAADKGGFALSWIGLVAPGAKNIVPVATGGADEGFLQDLTGRFSVSGSVELGNTIAAQAIRDRKIVVTKGLQDDPRIVLRERYAGLGIRSLALLPLLVADQAVGVFALYAGETDFFNAQELKLLADLAGNIAFAIDHIEKQERLDYFAYYDVLTGLANRRLFLEQTAVHMQGAVGRGHRLALFLIDLERFKNINDSLGRAAGDALLKQVAEWIAAHKLGSTLVARVGADHFALLLTEVDDEAHAIRLLEARIEAFQEHPFRLNDAVFRIAVKVGVALFPDDGPDADTLFRNAEAALKKAKARGERYLFYTRNMTAAVAGRLTLENQLRKALDREEFVLHYQPKVELGSGKVTGAEALIRWNDPLSGQVPPGRFIPVLEETGLIYEVGRWALRKSIEDYLRWRSAGLRAVRIAVNVSPLQLRNRSFVAEIGRKVGVEANAAAGLELETTESLIMEDVKHNIASLQAIRAMGVKIAIDDFGTGFSSLSYLAKLPVDTLKIDRSFVVDMTASPEGLALVSTIINLAHSLKLGVVAEGVETEEQSRLLRLLNCDEMQGFLFAKPMPAEEFEAKFLAAPAG